MSACVSGSPNRQLNSTTLRAVVGEHEARVEQSGERTSARASAQGRREDVARRLEHELSAESASALTHGQRRSRAARAGRRPCRRCSDPGRWSASACGPAARGATTNVLPSVRAKSDSSSPCHELLDEHLGAGVAERVALEHVVDRAVGVAERLADDDALAGGEAGRLDDDGRAEPTCAARLGAGDVACGLRRARSGCPSSSMSCLANAFDVSISAAARVGPKIGSPRARNASTMPASSGASGPTTVRSTASLARQRARAARCRCTPIGTHSPSSAMPGIARRGDELECRALHE